MIAEYNDDPLSSEFKWSKSYVYLGSRLLATLNPSQADEVLGYDHPDRLGTRLVTNTAGTPVAEQEMLPFGVTLDEKGIVAANQRFTSYDRSAATGLDYAVNRYYDPEQGRFTQVDLFEMGAANLMNPQSLNMYAYVRNDSVNATDPLGLRWVQTCLFGGKDEDEIDCFWTHVADQTPPTAPGKPPPPARGIAPTEPGSARRLGEGGEHNREALVELFEYAHGGKYVKSASELSILTFSVPFALAIGIGSDIVTAPFKLLLPK